MAKRINGFDDIFTKGSQMTRKTIYLLLGCSGSSTSGSKIYLHVLCGVMYSETWFLIVPKYPQAQMNIRGSLYVWDHICMVKIPHVYWHFLINISDKLVSNVSTDSLIHFRGHSIHKHNEYRTRAPNMESAIESLTYFNLKYCIQWWSPHTGVIIHISFCCMVSTMCCYRSGIICSINNRGIVKLFTDII